MEDSIEELNKMLDEIKTHEYASLDEQLIALEHLNDEIENKLGLSIPQARLPMALTKLNLVTGDAIESTVFNFAKSRQLENLLNQFTEIITDFMKGENEK